MIAAMADNSWGFEMRCIFLKANGMSFENFFSNDEYNAPAQAVAYYLEGWKQLLSRHYLARLSQGEDIGHADRVNRLGTH